MSAQFLACIFLLLTLADACPEQLFRHRTPTLALRTVGKTNQKLVFGGVGAEHATVPWSELFRLMALGYQLRRVKIRRPCLRLALCGIHLVYSRLMYFYVNAVRLIYVRVR